MSEARETAIVAFFEQFHEEFAPLLDKVYDAGEAAGFKRGCEETQAKLASHFADVAKRIESGLQRLETAPAPARTTTEPPAPPAAEVTTCELGELPAAWRALGRDPVRIEPAPEPALPFWTDERDEVLTDAWMCWVPEGDLLARLNDEPGAPLQARDLLPRTGEIRCARNVDYREECQRIWRATAAYSWTERIAAVLNHIEVSDARKRTARRDQMATRLATEPPAPQPSVKAAAPKVGTFQAGTKWTPERKAYLTEHFATVPYATLLATVNAMPGDEATMVQLKGYAAGSMGLRRPLPVETVKPALPQPTIVPAPPPVAPALLPAPGPDGRIHAPLSDLIAWSRSVGFHGFDGSNVDALNRWCVATLRPSVVVEWP